MKDYLPVKGNSMSDNKKSEILVEGLIPVKENIPIVEYLDVDISQYSDYKKVNDNGQTN